MAPLVLRKIDQSKLNILEFFFELTNQIWVFYVNTWWTRGMNMWPEINVSDNGRPMGQVQMAKRKAARQRMAVQGGFKSAQTVQGTNWATLHLTTYGNCCRVRSISCAWTDRIKTIFWNLSNIRFLLSCVSLNYASLVFIDDSLMWMQRRIRQWKQASAAAKGTDSTVDEQDTMALVGT